MTTLLNAAGGISASTSIIIIFALVTVFGALMGLLRGFGRQTVRTLTIIISGVLAVVFTISISNALNANLAGQTLEEVLSNASVNIDPELKELLFNLDAENSRIIAAVPTAIIGLPLIFTMSFIVISALGELVHIILCWIFKLKISNAKAASRFIGFIIGALQGALVAAIILFPFGCFANLSDKMMASIEDGGIKEGSAIEEIYDSLDTYLDDTKNNAIIKLVMNLGGNKLQDRLSLVTIEGEKVDAREAFYSLAGVLGDYSYLEDCDFKAPTAAQKDVISGIADKFTNDDYMATVLSGILRELSLAIKHGRLDISAEAVDEPYRSMLMDTIAIFETSSTENLKGDIDTFLDVYYQLADAGVLSAMSEGDGNGESSDTVVDKLTEKPDGTTTVIQSLINTLEENERTKPLVSMLAKLSVTIMAENLGVGEDAAEIYENVKTGLNAIGEIDKNQSAEEYKAAVNDVITSTLTQSGITEVEPEIIDTMSQYIADKKDEDIEFNEEYIDDIIFSYYDAYSEYINSLTP